LGGYAGAVCARIEYQSEWAFTIDPHGRPDSADLIAVGGRDEAWFGRLNHNFSEIILRLS
jgi:hypothetical protein